MGNYEFVWNCRLGIRLPRLRLEWAAYTKHERECILVQWEEIRGTIPQRIYELECRIRTEQERLYEEEDFEASCTINSRIAEFASRINDLHIWFRMNQELDSRRHA